MTTAQLESPVSRKALRLWPGVAAVTVLWLARFVVPLFVPGSILFGLLAELVCGLGVVVWWLFFSRSPWSERLSAVGVLIVALFATSRIIDKSIATGAEGMLFAILEIPVVCLAFVAWAVASNRLSDRYRHGTMVAAILVGCGVLALVRTEGFTGSFENNLKWRWAPSAEDRLLAQASEEPAAPVPPPPPMEAPEKHLVVNAGVTPVPSRPAPPSLAEPETTGDWPGFRGPGRDSIIPGVRIDTNWSARPPVKVWQRPVGPGWSSFAVRGGLVYTQEQRGPDEVVSCYRLTTGKPVWIHRDAARFWESNAGAGPRSTPTLGNGRVYTFGATGILNVLNAADGSVVWSRNAASDAKRETPEWGFASSPLLLGDTVIVAVSGQLVAYDIATGVPRWFGPYGGTSYSSPHLLRTDGVSQILLLSAAGITSLAPADGALLWEHAWKGYPIVQPALTAEGDVLLSVSDQSGTRRLAVTHGAGGWSAAERWTSPGLKPYFNDFVVHHGHAFGFDGSILSCIDLEDGKRKWKGGRFGNGQLVLLPDQDLLLVLSEQGELALVSATPDHFTEVARFPAIEGKTWNHPVLAGDILLVRNGEEMAAFRLTLAGH